MRTSQVRQQKSDLTGETWETRTKAITEPCERHPVDYDNRQDGAVCGQRKDVQAHPDKIKSYPHFRPRRRSQLR